VRLHKIGIDDVLADLPEVIPVSTARPELVLSALGFEDRAPAVVADLSTLGTFENGQLCLIRYPTNAEDNEKHYDEFCSAVGGEDKIIPINYERHDFQAQLGEIINANCTENHSVVLDISTMSSYVFFPTFFCLMEQDIDLHIAYCEAASYGPSKEEWEGVAARADEERELLVQSFENAEFQSHGIDVVYPYAPCYEYSSANRPTLVVAVPNFNPIRMSAMVRKADELENAEFDLQHWVVGVPPDPANEWRVEAVKRTNNLGNTGSAHLHTASTFDYREMLRVLDGIWTDNRYAGGFSIASLGSKLQQLGVAMFCRVHKETTLWLSEPVEFSGSGYSKGRGRSWSVALGSTPRLRELLDSYGSYEWPAVGAESNALSPDV